MEIDTLKKICMLGKVRSTDGGDYKLSDDIIVYCMAELEKLGYTPEFDGNNIYAKGTFPVLLAAHMDTWFRNPITKIIQEGNKLSSPQGIGGDDRCGIYMVLELVKEFHCSVLLSTYEEVFDSYSGSVYDFINSEYRPKSLDVDYVMEFDEPGKDGVVYYEIGNRAFEKFIEQDGYFTRHDSDGQTDIRFITVAYNLAGVNIPCGYYCNHFEDEYINFDETEASLNVARKILKRTAHKKFDYLSSGTKLVFDDDDVVHLTLKSIKYQQEYDRVFRLLWYFTVCSPHNGVILGFAEGFHEIPDEAFPECISLDSGAVRLKQLILPHSLYFIGRKSFAGIVVDEPVILPEHIHALHNGAFCGEYQEIRTIRATGEMLFVSDDAIGDNATLIEERK